MPSLQTETREVEFSAEISITEAPFRSRMRALATLSLLDHPEICKAQTRLLI